MKIYLAGPMRGYPFLNARAFDSLKKEWEQFGHTVVSPIDLDRANGLDPYNYDPEELNRLCNKPEWIRQAMHIDLAVIDHVDGVAVLQGWECSAGATVEVAYAQFLGRPLYDAERPSKEPTTLFVKPKPWAWCTESRERELKRLGWQEGYDACSCYLQRG